MTAGMLLAGLLLLGGVGAASVAALKAVAHSIPNDPLIRRTVRMVGWVSAGVAALVAIVGSLICRRDDDALSVGTVVRVVATMLVLMFVASHVR
jgi:hypothetical protein